MAKKKPEKKFREEDLKYIITALNYLTQTFVSDHPYVSRIWRHLRALLLPQDSDSYTSDNDYNYPLYDPAPIKALDRSVSGYQSYHISPNDTYFELASRGNILKTKDDPKIDLEHALHKRTEDIHDIKQSPENYSILTRNIRDKIVFNLAGRTIDEHPTAVAKFEYYAPEELALASSNGRVNDIFGVRRAMTPFQFNYRFPKRMTKFRDYVSDFGDIFRPKYRETNQEMHNMVYRFNIPVSVLRQYLLIGKTEADKEYMSALESLLPLDESKDDVQWADIWFTEDDLLELTITPFRKIIISKMYPEHLPMGIGKGIGEKALGIAIELNEIAQINLVGYQRTYGPSFSVFGESTSLAIDLNMDAINYITEGDKPITSNSLNLNTDAIINYWNFMQAKIEKMFDLDTFEMLNKNRMPTAEVELRKSDDYRKLGLYLAQDNYDDLNPTVLVINYLIHQHHEKNNTTDELSQYVLDARYVSAIAMAHKNSSLDQAMSVLNVVDAAKKITQQEDELSDSINPKKYLEKILVKTKAKDLVIGEEEQKERAEDRKELIELKKTQEEAAALTNIGNAINANEPGSGQQTTGNLQQGTGGVSESDRSPNVAAIGQS